MFRTFINSFVSFHYILKTFNYLDEIHFFVQVGAHDGLMHDPLHFFLSSNRWNGILIEPQKEMLTLFKNRYKHRDNLFFSESAVHPTESSVKLFKIKNPENYSQTGWATIIPNGLSDHQGEKELEVIVVKAMHLMKIIQNTNFKKIDLLQIDTEGFDYEVLKMFDFKLYKPLLVQYEHCHLSKENFKKSINILCDNGYLTLRKKNDVIAIKKENIKIKFILYYLFFRLSASFKSRIGSQSN